VFFCGILPIPAGDDISVKAWEFLLQALNSIRFDSNDFVECMGVNLPVAAASAIAELTPTAAPHIRCGAVFVPEPGIHVSMDVDYFSHPILLIGYRHHLGSPFGSRSVQKLFSNIVGTHFQSLGDFRHE
jgi:hypothetical protein